MREISFFEISLSAPYEALKNLILDDKVLTEKMLEFSNKLKKDNIETFKIDRNMIVTESGYNFCIYSDDIDSLLQKIE